MSSTLPFDPASPDEFVAWLKANRACKEAVAWVGDRSAIEALEALAALEPTPQHIAWSCWAADRVLPEDARRRLRAALLRTMPEYLVVTPAVAGAIKALEDEPFDPERFEAARTVAAVARGQATSNEAWAVAWAMTAAYESAAAEAAAKAARVAKATAYAAVGEAAEAAADADVKDVLRQQLAVVKDALNNHLKTLES
jgi:hypothetical protein